MKQYLLLAIIGVGGLAVGGTGGYIISSGSTNSTEVPTVTKEQVVAAIETDPSVCEAVGLDIPTDEEAQAAFNQANRSSPLAYNRENDPEISVKLGQCDKNSMGPGVACMATVKYTPQAEPQTRTIGFAKSAEGEWVATPY